MAAENKEREKKVGSEVVKSRTVSLDDSELHLESIPKAVANGHKPGHFHRKRVAKLRVQIQLAKVAVTNGHTLFGGFVRDWLAFCLTAKVKAIGPIDPFDLKVVERVARLPTFRAPKDLDVLVAYSADEFKKFVRDTLGWEITNAVRMEDPCYGGVRHNGLKLTVVEPLTEISVDVDAVRESHGSREFKDFDVNWLTFNQSRGLVLDCDPPRPPRCDGMSALGELMHRATESAEMRVAQMAARRECTFLFSQRRGRYGDARLRSMAKRLIKMLVRGFVVMNISWLDGKFHLNTHRCNVCLRDRTKCWFAEFSCKHDVCAECAVPFLAGEMAKSGSRIRCPLCRQEYPLP
jgi:hypothetical protein